MAEQLIGQGEGNLVPDSKIKKYLLNEACDAGDCVSIVGASGYTVEQTDATTDDGIGVVRVAGVAGAWVEVYVGGYCPKVLCDSGMAAGDYLAAGATAGSADDSTTKTALTFGLALTPYASGFCTAILFDKIGS